MNGSWGERLRVRARELGLNDSQVARRIGMTQRRYSSYVNMSREPGFADLLRICEALSTTPDFILGVSPVVPGDDAVRRAGAAVAAMEDVARPFALAALEAMAGVQPRRRPGRKT